MGLPLPFLRELEPIPSLGKPEHLWQRRLRKHSFCQPLFFESLLLLFRETRRSSRRFPPWLFPSSVLLLEAEAQAHTTAEGPPQQFRFSTSPCLSQAWATQQLSQWLSLLSLNPSQTLSAHAFDC